jgi:penicillin-binding protein 1C
MACLYPNAGSVVYVPIDLDGRRGRVVLEATHRDPSATVYWHIDDEYVGMTNEIHQLSVAPSPGWHRLTLVDEAGERIVRRFQVLARE